MKITRILGISFGCLILLCQICHANHFFLEASELQKKGVNYTKLEPVNLTHDGGYFVSTEPVEDLQLRAKGICRVLKVFKFADKKLSRIDTIQLPITHWVNAAVSDRKNEVMVLGNQGTKVLKVDLDTLQAHTVWQHQKGKEGFKAGPVIVTSRGNYFATGWFYDSEQFWKGDYLAQLSVRDKAEESKIQFTKKVNLDELFNQPGGFSKAFYYVSGDQVLYNFVKPDEKKTSLLLYKSGKIIEIDKGYMLTIFIGSPTKVFYSVIYEEDPKVLKHFVKDIRTGKKVTIGKDHDPFTYPFLSEKGDRLVVVVLDNKYKKMSAYFGDEKEGYALRKFIHRKPFGPMKLSADGKVYLLMTTEGIHVGYF